MRLTTRLLLLLVPTVAGIMALYAFWAIRERERTLLPVLQRETEAYATALAASLDQAIRDRPPENVQGLLDLISQTPTVYAIVVYDGTGAATFTSGPAPNAAAASAEIVRRVLNGETMRQERLLGAEAVYSVLEPIQDHAGLVTGAIEVAQPVTVVSRARSQVRQRYFLNTLTLIGAVSILIFVLVGRLVAQPIDRFVHAVEAVGRGELGRRVQPVPSGGELTALWQAFNGMAESLERARVRAEREAGERLALERGIRETEKLAAIGNLAAGLAHEIAAPLNVISGRAELLLTTPPDVGTRERHLRIIVTQIERITRIVRNLLDYGRRREPRYRPCDLHATAATALEFLEGECARAGIGTSMGGDVVMVHADSDQLHQIFVNLLLNGIEAMEGASAHKELSIRVEERDGSAVAEIRDTGPGIESDRLSHLFTPFLTTKPRGTGLGLVVARSIAEEHGGHLDVESKLGEGAVFRLHLPLHASDTS